MHRAAIIFIISITVAGCATQPRYLMVKNVPQSEVTRDDANCRAQSEMVQIADWEYRGTFMEGANIKSKQDRAYELCMVGKGYTKQSAEEKKAVVQF